MKLHTYINKVLLKTLPVICFVFLIVFFTRNLFYVDLYRFFGTIIVSVLSMPILIYKIGLSDKERQTIIGFFNDMKKNVNV